MGEEEDKETNPNKRLRESLEVEMTVTNETLDVPVPFPVSSSGQISDENNKTSSDASETLSFQVFTNDGTRESNIALITLKNIFSRQLPKMPKEYIVRLVMDHRHFTLAILLDKKIIGGICYRPYNEQKFGEIAFCAISGEVQIKGYGTILMNQLKSHVQKHRLEYFLTYADNFAIGYFQKQGFSKNLSMPKERWVGYIKDYDGGTLMECYIHPNMDYVHIPEVVRKQRQYIYNRIFERSQSHKVYSGDIFQNDNQFSSAFDIPGVQEAGWTSLHILRGTTERDRNIALKKLTSLIETVMEKINQNQHSWPFKIPLDVSMIPENDKQKHHHIDLDIINTRVRSGSYYRTREMIVADLSRMTANCRKIYGEGTEHSVAADHIDKIVHELLIKDMITTVSSGKSND